MMLRCAKCECGHELYDSKFRIDGVEVCRSCFQKAQREMFEDSEVNHKHDNGKPRLDLVPPSLIEAVGVIRTYGTDKYGDPGGWRKVEPERYTAALMRHLCEFLRDPYSTDDESGLPHSWHMACNVAFLIELYGGEGRWQ